jgi:hypothetical protein
VLVCSARPDLEEVSPGFWLGGSAANGRAGRPSAPIRRPRSSQTLRAIPPWQATPFASALIENAGGNPLFLEETVRMLRDEGLIDLERWRSGEARDLPIPTSVQGLISLATRPPGARGEAARPPRLGGRPVFWAGAVAHLGVQDGTPPDDPRPGLGKLERRDFVAHKAVSTVAGEDEYAFKHILMRDVAYGQVPKGRRAQLHLRFSDWVTVVRGKAEEFIEIVAWHLEQACGLSREVARSPIEPPIRQAAEALAKAAGRAERRESLREARRYYTRALDVLGDDHADLRAELRLRRADILMMLGELKEASDELEEVRGAASALERTDIACEASLLLGDIDQRQGRAADAHERLTKAQDLARSTGDAYLRIKVAYVLAALVADFEGQYEQAIDGLHSESPPPTRSATSRSLRKATFGSRRP